jgi:hypothetical protein
MVVITMHFINNGQKGIQGAQKGRNWYGFLHAFAQKSYGPGLGGGGRAWEARGTFLASCGSKESDRG